MGFPSGMVGPDPLCRERGRASASVSLHVLPSLPLCAAAALDSHCTAQFHPAGYLILKLLACLIFILNSEEKKGPSFNLGCASN